MRLNISKLAASATMEPPVSEGIRYDNALLQNHPWTEDLVFLREMFNDISLLGEETQKSPEMNASEYERIEPKLRELLTGVSKVVMQVTWLKPVIQYMSAARKDIENAALAYSKGDFPSAVMSQIYAMSKFRSILAGLNEVAKLPSRHRNARFIDKLAYGYDISGEVFEGSGEIANRENQTNINDTATPQRHHETGPNPANMIRDVDADKGFPEIAEKKNETIHWPPRSR